MLLPDLIDSLAAETGFAGVVSVDRGGEIEFVRAYGLANRAYQVPNTTDTRFGLASGVKGLTALTVVGLIERDALSLATTARSVLGNDLPLIGDGVTIEHLLAHRSGIGDYLDEEADGEITDYTLTVPVQELATTEQYLAVLDGYPAEVRARRAVLLLQRRLRRPGADRRTGQRDPFGELLRERVTSPAGMRDTEFLRSDELPGRTATGYLPSRAGPGRTCSTCRSWAAATAGSTPRPPTSARSGCPCSRGRIVVRALGGRDGAAPQRRAG